MSRSNLNLPSYYRNEFLDPHKLVLQKASPWSLHSDSPARGSWNRYETIIVPGRHSQASFRLRVSIRGLQPKNHDSISGWDALLKHVLTQKAWLLTLFCRPTKKPSNKKAARAQAWAVQQAKNTKKTLDGEKKKRNHLKQIHQDHKKVEAFKKVKQWVQSSASLQQGLKKSTKTVLKLTFQHLGYSLSIAQWSEAVIHHSTAEWSCEEGDWNEPTAATSFIVCRTEKRGRLGSSLVHFLRVSTVMAKKYQFK